MASGSDEIKYDSIEWSGVAIAFSWCHSRRKTLGITVHPDKSVAVRAPLRTALKDIRIFVANKAEWVVRVWKKLDTRQSGPVQDYGRGALFMYQGKALRLEFTTGPHSSLLVHDGFLIMTVPELPSEEKVRKMIDRWYRNQAAEIVKARSAECHRMMHDQGIPLPPVTIRPMKTRWGSYSYRTGRITLNLNLVKAPQACLDYVIIHELCHIKVRHHGPDFWKLVSRYFPDYLKARKELNKYS